MYSEVQRPELPDDRIDLLVSALTLETAMYVHGRAGGVI